MIVDLVAVAYEAFTPDQRRRLSLQRLHIETLRTWSNMRAGLIHAWAEDLYLALSDDLVGQVERAWELLDQAGIHYWDEPGSEPYEDVGLAVAYAISALWFLARERHWPALPTAGECERFLADPLKGLPMFEGMA